MTGSGLRLARLFCLDSDDYLELVERRNLLPGSMAWNPIAARTAARTMKLYNCDVVCLGSRVARAFGLKAEWLIAQPMQRAVFYVIPHPSGRNRWYNDFDNRSAVRRLLRQLVGLRPAKEEKEA